ncbi:MAG: hypothetical protein HC888_18580 [Candidatus Competibacteraceae bacterium]|nr:hypothetical protein [Candidatus Competibacteraceae bacterium]
MARRALGAVLAQQDRLDEAERELKMAAELQPRKPGGHLDLALFYARYQPDRAEDTIRALKEAIVHAPQLREDILKTRALPRFIRSPHSPHSAKGLRPTEGGPRPERTEPVDQHQGLGRRI